MTTRANGVRQRALRGLVAVVGVAAIAVGGLSVANAATLTVNGGGVSTLEAAPCTTQRINLQRNWLIVFYAVTLSGIPASCQGKPIIVSASNDSINGTSSGATSSSVQIRTDNSWTAPTFTVLIDGWIVPVNQ